MRNIAIALLDIIRPSARLLERIRGWVGGWVAMKLNLSTAV
jgi:hypothetical protein